MGNQGCSIWVIAVVALACGACGASGEGAAADADEAAGHVETLEEEELARGVHARSLDVEVEDCAEWVGIGGIPAGPARAAVPPEFTLAGDASQAVLVVRVVECQDVHIGNQELGHTRTTQIGVNLVGPDSTADINNYTLWYTTDQPLLAARLTAAGARAYVARDLDFVLRPDGQLKIRATSARAPAFTVRGSANVPASSPVSFTASWWKLDAAEHPVRSRSVFPEIRFGVAQTQLTTPPGSELATILGGTTLSFAFLDSYNTFPDARLEVRHVE